MRVTEIRQKNSSNLFNTLGGIFRNNDPLKHEQHGARVLPTIYVKCFPVDSQKSMYPRIQTAEFSELKNRFFSEKVWFIVVRRLVAGGSVSLQTPEDTLVRWDEQVLTGDTEKIRESCLCNLFFGSVIAVIARLARVSPPLL